MRLQQVGQQVAYLGAEPWWVVSSNTDLTSLQWNLVLPAPRDVFCTAYAAGNSGGPLLDSGGCLIGINTAIYSPSGANSGVGFAIPVDVVNSSVQQIITYGKVVRPVLGISFAPDQSSEQLGVKGMWSPGAGSCNWLL